MIRVYFYIAGRSSRTCEGVSKLSTRTNDVEQKAQTEGALRAVRSQRQDQSNRDGSGGMGVESREGPRGVRERFEDDQERDRETGTNSNHRF